MEQLINALKSMDLSRFETHNKGRKMTKEERRKASIDLSLQYLQSYYTDWRLVKVLSNSKLLNERYEHFGSLMSELRQEGNENSTAFIAQEIKNGLYFDSIAHCVQYVEDLFALMRAAQNKDYFIRNVITYKAGEITNFIKSFKINPQTAGRLYRIPENLENFKEENIALVTKGKETLASLTTDIVTFYKNYEFMYNQYKHGLSVGLRPFGNTYTKEQIDKDVKGEMGPYLAVYDNLNLKAAQSKGTVNLLHGVMMPGFTDNVRPFIKDLSEENNYLRLVFPHDHYHFSMKILVEHARKARACMETFITNYAQAIRYTQGEYKFVFPDNYDKNIYNVVNYTPAPEN